MKLFLNYVSLMIIIAGVARADIPVKIPYQGQLFDPAGMPINATLDMEVNVFTNQTGGTALWSDTVIGVDVVNGMYGFQFGDLALVDVLTNDFCFVELTIEGSTLSPRHRLVSVPYALHTRKAEQLDPAIPGVPSGVIILWSGTLDTIPEGWALCDGQNDTPDLRERFIMGAATTNDIGTTVGTNSFSLTQAQMAQHNHTASSSSAGNHSHSASSGSGGNHDHAQFNTSYNGSHGHTIRKDNSYGSHGSRASDAWYKHYTVGYADRHTSTSGHHGHGFSINSKGNHSHSVSIGTNGEHTHSITMNSTGSGAPIQNRPAYYEMAYIIKL